MPKIFTLEFWKGLWDDFVQYLDDLPLRILKKFLDAIATLIESVSPPDFLQGHSLGEYLGPAMQYIGYFLDRAGVDTAIALLASAVAFRAVRKILTFGLW